ncbi:Rep [Mosquito VEM virus SDRBAJ]|uniref:Rep n=1 Tax=Mosquito VEM virus SDRBAJ TaxID=1034806 RepID=UPI000211765C|nr:Rep [Mosquito VEM virus SDRBAJ]AEF58777.1 Rep [Mosquito VEM virus SDRBAJ]
MPKSAPEKKYRNWVFTYNNPPQPYGNLAIEGSKYFTYQLERGAAGTEHYQGLVVFTNRVRFATVKALLPGCHIESMKGTLKQAIAYCHKDDTRIDGPWAVGDVPPGSGARTDLLALKEAVEEGKSEKEIADEHFCSWIKYYKGIERYRRIVVAHRFTYSSFLSLSPSHC